MYYKIKEAREERSLSQEELSQRSGVSRSIISGLESGREVVTTTGTLKKIAEVLGKKVTDLYFD